jgi:hypothetical protein
MKRARPSRGCRSHEVGTALPAGTRRATPMRDSPRPAAMKTYIPELSEHHMVRRAPDRPVDFGADRDYIFACLKDVEQSFGIDGFPGLAPEQIPARALIKQFIVWWRTLEPANETQQGAYGRMPGAIRLIDTVSTWLAERASRTRGN